jgi:hypothetical protein
VTKHLLESIATGAEFTVSLTGQGEVTLIHPPPRWYAGDIGITSYELPGVCLTPVKAAGSGTTAPGVALRRLDQRWGKGLPYQLIHYHETIAGLTLDRRGCPCISIRCYTYRGICLLRADLRSPSHRVFRQCR